MRILRLGLVTALAATTLLAQGRMGPRDGSRTPNFDALKEALTLTDAQIAAIQQNNEAVREQVRAVFEQAREKHEALEAELENANPNPTIVGQLMLDARAIREQAGELRDAARAQNVALLDAQQQAALATLTEAGRSSALRQAGALNLLERPEGRGGPGGPGGPGMDGPHPGPRRGGFGGGPRG